MEILSKYLTVETIKPWRSVLSIQRGAFEQYQCVFYAVTVTRFLLTAQRDFNVSVISMMQSKRGSAMFGKTEQSFFKESLPWCSRYPPTPNGLPCTALCDVHKMYARTFMLFICQILIWKCCFRKRNVITWAKRFHYVLFPSLNQRFPSNGPRDFQCRQPKRWNIQYIYPLTFYSEGPEMCDDVSDLSLNTKVLPELVGC